MAYGKQTLADLREPSKNLRSKIGDVYAGFGAVHKAALADGALDTKTKELIALAISITSQCDGCISSHARGAASAGATEEEVAEMIGVAILMAGGPATVYGPRALEAFQEFAG
ncbi:MAG TPA: carboxymuconolactone decarboxylase family protein [Propionibacterium sp.]|jgi:AhpD family alkylhydroperoxidase|nr:carboxymuconolactone decarboxylase family protein [Propionibacterium sp.]